MAAQPATAESTLTLLGITRENLSPGEQSYFDATKAYEDRVARILAENGGEVICPRCSRPALGWHLKRADRCNIPGAVYCMRDPQAILDDIARRAAKAGRKTAAA